jgi:hypothetical protein
LSLIFENHDLDLEFFFDDEAEVRFTTDNNFLQKQRVLCYAKHPLKFYN